MRKTPELKTWNALKNAMVFIFISRGTNSARSSSQISMQRKITIMRQKPTSVPMTSAEPHDFVTPPHCRARIRQTKAAISTKVPRRSICRIFSFRVAC